MGIGRRRGDGGLITRTIVGVIGAAALLFGVWAFSGQPDLVAMFAP